MSMPPLPRQADFRKLAAAGARLSGHVPLVELSRLRKLLVSEQGEVNVDLGFGIDDEGYRVIEGQVRASLTMQCQRCLGEVRIEVDSSLGLAMVWGEQDIPALPSRYEGLVVGTESQDPYELVEEELLLALPLVARHDEGSCRMDLPASTDEAGETAKESPFVAALKGRGKT